MDFGSYVWYSNRTNEEQSEIPQYGKPVKVVTRPNFLTVTPVIGRGLLEVLKSGESVYDSWTVIVNPIVFNEKINVGDLMWVDGDEPTEVDSEFFDYRQSATAVVEKVQKIRRTLHIFLRRNQEKQ